VGQDVVFTATLASRSDAPQSLAVNLAVHFVKASGAVRPKIFRLRSLELPARGAVELSKTISLRQMSTRRHHAGAHAVELLVNGEAFPAGTFEVTPARGVARSTRRGRAPVSRRPV
jgi:hypothetical protein